MSERLTLDVGCGLNKRYSHSVPRGDINCDLQKPLMKINNFVLCDSQHLPFRNEIFSYVYSNHVIEHVDNPFLMLREILRVSKNRILIRTPHRMLSLRAYKNHKMHFNIKWFVNALGKLGIIKKYTITYSRYKCFPHQFIPIIQIPEELEIKINLNTQIVGE